MPTIFERLTLVFIACAFILPAYGGRSLSKPIDFPKELIRRTPDKKPIRTPVKAELGKSLLTNDWKIWQETSKAQVSERSFHKSQPISVFNERTRQAGRITGGIELKLKLNSDLEEILKDHRLTATDSFENLHLHFVVSNQETFDLVHLVQELKADPRIESVNVEIASRKYEKL